RFASQTIYKPVDLGRTNGPCMTQSDSIGMTPGAGTSRIRKLRCTSTKIILKDTPSKKSLLAGQVVIEPCGIYALIVAQRSIETEPSSVEQCVRFAVTLSEIVSGKFACYGSQRRNCHRVLFHCWE